MNNAKTAQIIKDLCKIRSVSISNLLADCDIRKSLIYDMEKRNKTPSAQTLEAIAEYLNCTTDYLLGRVNKEATEKTQQYKERLEEEKNLLLQQITASIDETQKHIIINATDKEAGDLDDFCRKHGYNKNDFVKAAIREKMDREEG